MARSQTRWLRAAFALALLLVLAGNVMAQEQPLDPTAAPDHGIAAGGVGFRPDPFRIEGVAGGGAVDAYSRNLGTDCTGLISVQPAFRFQALTRFDVLRFIFVADAVTADASLIVLDPNGNFHCNNDSYGLNNPTVDLDGAPAGDYNVWVGALTDRVMGDLYVTTRADVTPGSTGLIVPIQTPTPTLAPTATPIPPSALNPTLDPLAGTDNLLAGFLPDPYFRVVTAGGALSVKDSVVGDDCAGFTTSAPSFRVHWSNASTRLRFLFTPYENTVVNGLAVTLDAQNPPDMALIVEDPNGGWSCNRDFAPGYSAPQVEFINPDEGTYNVWVSDENQPDTRTLGVLYVTEKTYSPETVPTAGTAPTTPISGLTRTTALFSYEGDGADPDTIPGLFAGGAVDVGAQNKDCPGTFPATQSYGFLLPQPTDYLRIFFVADNDPNADPRLIVRMPDGTWYCDDDSLRSRQPVIDVIGNTSTGLVSIWIGSPSSDVQIEGSLTITRGGANPLDPTRPPPVLAGSGNPAGG